MWKLTVRRHEGWTALGYGVNGLCLLVRLIGLLGLLASGCSGGSTVSNDLAADHSVVASSQHPVAVEPARVGSYPALSKSGGGYFYDDVLEYRVWVHPKEGDVYYRAFASFEPALQFSKATERAEEPLVLVRQLRWVNEPKPGQFEPRSDERVTEWQVAWLAGSKRGENSIAKFLGDKGAQVAGVTNAAVDTPGVTNLGTGSR